MSWYSRYLSVSGKPLDMVSDKVLSEIKNKIRRLNYDKPVASVVVIAHNEETTLLSCLWSLSENICNFPIEIIGVDNNSTDRTREVFDAVGVKCFWEEKKSCGYARQCGLNHAKGNYYLSIDSDILYPKQYIQTMVDHLRKPGISAVSSRYNYIPDNRHRRFSLKVYEFLREAHVFCQSFQRPELSVRGGVFAYKTEYGRRVGYRVDIITGEDGSMALGLKEYGKVRLIYNQKARAVTYISRASRKESLSKNLLNGILKSIRSPGRYFVKKSVYKDKPSNLINAVKNSDFPD